MAFEDQVAVGLVGVEVEVDFFGEYRAGVRVGVS